MAETATRLEALRERLRGDACYISGLVNIRYLTGFSGSSGHLLVLPDRATLFTDGRYRLQAEEQTDGIDVQITFGDSRPDLVKAVQQLRLKKLRFEANRMSYASYSYLSNGLPKCRVVALTGAVEALREVKSAAEIDAIRRSAALNSAAFEEVCGRAVPAWTEARFAAEVEYEFRVRGGEGAAFPTIVASGPHGALPHAEPRDVPIQARSPVVVDHGVILNGYCSDMTRMVSFGRPVRKWTKLIRAVREAQEAAIDAIRPGVHCHTVDRRARQVLKKWTVGGSRLDRRFTHSTGHGLGLEIHEGPRVAPRERQRLKEGMVITVEPGVYLDRLGGVRIEDVVAVTSAGCEVLSSTSRDLRVLGEAGAGRDG